MLGADTNYPIIEALCEFQFLPDQPWDMTIPGLFYEKVRNEFPIKEQKTDVGIAFAPQKAGLEHKVEMSQRIQFWKNDKSAVVQIGPNLLAVNQLKPYISWDAFKPLILSNLNTYIEIAKPRAYKRIGLRYINNIVVEKDKTELKDYFKYYPFIPEELPQIHGPFNVRVEFPYENGRDMLFLTFASIPPEKPNLSYFLLDLDYVLSKPESISLDKADGWIEKAKIILNNVFKACITDSCKELFKGVANVVTKSSN